MSLDQLKRHIKTRIEYINPFGDICVLKLPEDCNMVVLAINKGFGLNPVWVGLPGQVYVEKINELIKEHHAREIIAIPYNHENCISIIGNVTTSRENANAWTT